MSQIPKYVDHKKAVNMIAKKFNKDPKEIDKIIRGFFGPYGIQQLIRSQIKFRLPILGKLIINEKVSKLKQKKKDDRNELKKVYRKRQRLNK